MSAEGVKRKLGLLMKKSGDEIEAVKHLIDIGHYSVAISRCYFMAFAGH